MTSCPQTVRNGPLSMPRMWVAGLVALKSLSGLCKCGSRVQQQVFLMGFTQAAAVRCILSCFYVNSGGPSCHICNVCTEFTQGNGDASVCVCVLHVGCGRKGVGGCNSKAHIVESTCMAACETRPKLGKKQNVATFTSQLTANS